MTQLTQSTNLMTDLDKRFDAAVAGIAPITYISADEMAFIRARAVTLRAEASQAFFQKIAGLFRSSPSEWISGHAAAAK